MSIAGKTVALIGSTGILGSEYVNFLSKNNVTLIIGDENISRCNLLADQMEKEGYARPETCRIDLYDEGSIVNFFKVIADNYKQLDTLINNAQVKPPGFYDSFENYTKETLMSVLDGNTVGMTLSCREACKIFLKQGKGNIINVASIYGLKAADQSLYDNVKNIYNPDERFSSPVSYAVSKAAVLHLTRYLASYYRGKNIRVNTLTPGGVFDNHDDEFVSAYAKRNFLNRMADRTDYNGAIEFLISDKSSYMTGANIVVDGGWTVA
ncbi:SDR family oxidoreductase [Roseivirga thermotolerans]|uniref:Oxidoreductase n=1 Tax=Roseivirga thermotolerans TaxID=1758176 RepID=A0ABQ3I0P4_9BACT|nr:SDR family oxidoreductase [Roseivirga thermotolerans]GHE53471.1 oxidoreductase [Roseivirga thermotolerans]